MKNKENRDPGAAGKGSVRPLGLVTRIAGAGTLIAMLVLGTTGAVAILVTAAVMALVGFAGSRLAVKRFHREGKPPLNPDFGGFTGQLP